MSLSANSLSGGFSPLILSLVGFLHLAESSTNSWSYSLQLPPRERKPGRTKLEENLIEFSADPVAKIKELV